MKNNKGIILRDVVFIFMVIAIVSLSCFMGWYFINHMMKIETARNVGQSVEETAIGYYRNFLLRPEEYSEILFDLSNKNTDLSQRIIGRRPSAGEVFIRPVTELTGEVSVAVYFDGFCATKYYRETKFVIKQMDATECILDEAKLKISKKEYSEYLNKPLEQEGIIPDVGEIQEQ